MLLEPFPIPWSWLTEKLGSKNQNLSLSHQRRRKLQTTRDTQWRGFKYNITLLSNNIIKSVWFQLDIVKSGDWFDLGYLTHPT
jgi:hypothetical protein